MLPTKMLLRCRVAVPFSGFLYPSFALLCIGCMLVCLCVCVRVGGCVGVRLCVCVCVLCFCTLAFYFPCARCFANACAFGVSGQSWGNYSAPPTEGMHLFSTESIPGTGSVHSGIMHTLSVLCLINLTRNDSLLQAPGRWQTIDRHHLGTSLLHQITTVGTYVCHTLNLAKHIAKYAERQKIDKQTNK